MNFSFLDKYLSYFVSGAGITVIISLVTVCLGTLIGLAMALLKLSKHKPLNWLANIYIEVLRGTPMLLQITIGFLILQGFFPSKDLDVGVLTVSLSRLFPGMIVLSLNSGAYVAEIIRGGIISIPKGQTEAAYSIGMTYGQTIQRIILPQAIRVSIPALGNTFLSLIKDTSLLGFILVAEMFRKAQEVASTTYEYLTIYVLVALMYWVVCFIISIIQGIYESYIERGYRS